MSLFESARLDAAAAATVQMNDDHVAKTANIFGVTLDGATYGASLQAFPHRIVLVWFFRR